MAKASPSRNKQALEKARKALERAEFRFDYLETIQHFRHISRETCIRRQLCHTSAKNGTLHCAQPAAFFFRGHDDEVYFVCFECALKGLRPGFPLPLLEDIENLGHTGGQGKKKS